MNNKLVSLDLLQTDGGVSIKQGDTWSRLAYQLLDENSEQVVVEDATKVRVYLKNEKAVHVIPGILENGEVAFRLTNDVMNGSYTVEIQINHEDGSVSKYPSVNTIVLKVVKTLVQHENNQLLVAADEYNRKLPEVDGEKVVVGSFTDHIGDSLIINTAHIANMITFHSLIPIENLFFPRLKEIKDEYGPDFINWIEGGVTDGYVIDGTHGRGTHGGVINIDEAYDSIVINFTPTVVTEPTVVTIPYIDKNTAKEYELNIQVFPYHYWDMTTNTIRIVEEETGNLVLEDHISEEPVVETEPEAVEEVTVITEDDEEVVVPETETVIVEDVVPDIPHIVIPDFTMVPDKNGNEYYIPTVYYTGQEYIKPGQDEFVYIRHRQTNDLFKIPTKYPTWLTGTEIESRIAEFLFVDASTQLVVGDVIIGSALEYLYGYTDNLKYYNHYSIMEIEDDEEPIVGYMLSYTKNQNIMDDIEQAFAIWMTGYGG